jgi:hypothetical protein
MNNVAKAIKKTGLSVREFCEKELNVKYKAFVARVNQNRLYPAEIFYIVWRTKTSVQEMFGMSFNELMITTQGGEIVDKVRDILKNMSEPEMSQMLELMGHHAPKAGVKKKPIRIGKHTVVDEVPEPKKKESQVEEEGLRKEEDPLKGFFKQIY